MDKSNVLLAIVGVCLFIWRQIYSLANTEHVVSIYFDLKKQKKHSKTFQLQQGDS